MRHVRIRVQACGICHSDDELGELVSEWTAGQRVGVGWHGGQDGTCPSCRRGDFRNCRSLKTPGIGYDGAPLLCAGLTTFNSLRHSGALPGDLVAVQGIGGLGRLGIQYAKKLGYKVAAIGRDSENAALAIKLGASVYIDSNAASPAEELQKLGGAQVILATAPNSKAMSSLVGGLAPNGKLLVIGATFDPIEVTPIQLIIDWRASHDRNLFPRKSRGGLRAHDEWQCQVSHRTDDVKAN